MDIEVRWKKDNSNNIGIEFYPQDGNVGEFVPNNEVLEHISTLCQLMSKISTITNITCDYWGYTFYISREKGA